METKDVKLNVENEALENKTQELNDADLENVSGGIIYFSIGDDEKKPDEKLKKGMFN